MNEQEALARMGSPDRVEAIITLLSLKHWSLIHLPLATFTYLSGSGHYWKYGISKQELIDAYDVAMKTERDTAAKKIVADLLGGI